MKKITTHIRKLMPSVFAITSLLGAGGCGSDDANKPLNDARDGKVYLTATIGSRTWMAENLNYASHACGESWCYGNKAAYCAKYGRLYDWCAAMSACPSGWRLPTEDDWDDLIQAADGKKAAGAKLKSQSGWDGGGNGTDQFGFSALPGGYGRSDMRTFIGAGLGGFWWSATDVGALIIGYGYDGVETHAIGSQAGLSVRCVRD